MKDRYSGEMDRLEPRREKLDEKFLYGELTQEPYYIKKMYKGFKAKIPVRAMTDWSIDLGGTVVTPDSAYLMVWE